MMQLTSMRLSDEEAKEEYGGAPQVESGDLPKYPYGLCIDLCDEALAKLGITQMPPVGSVMQLMATVEVSRSSQYENQEGKEFSLGLQITDMALSAPQQKAEPARSAGQMAGALYGE